MLEKSTLVHHVFYPAEEFGNHFDEFDFFAVGQKFPGSFITYVKPTSSFAGCYLVWSGEDTKKAMDEAIGQAVERATA